MLGSSIVAPSGASWATGFLNAAFYRRPREERSVEELRLAHCILGTAWWRRGRRLGARERGAFHDAFDARQLDRDALLEGAAEMLGDWFPEARLIPPGAGTESCSPPSGTGRRSTGRPPRTRGAARADPAA